MLTTVLQIAFGALTARILSPEAFGGYVAALSLYGLLTVIAFTGIPSLVVAIDPLPLERLRSLRRTIWLSAVAITAVYLLLSRLWLHLLKAPSGSPYVPLIAAALLLAPAVSLESALLRRRGRSGQDAIAFALASCVGYVCAACVLLTSRSSIALAIAPIASGLIQYAYSRARTAALRDDEADSASLQHGTRGLDQPVRFLLRVSLQNLGFFGLGQLPTYIISFGGGSAVLGQYSRATTLTALPANTLAASLTRAAHPFWRAGLRRPDLWNGQVAMVVRLVGTLCALTFGLLAGVGSILAAVWLGPGWTTAGELVAPLSAAFGFQGLFTVLANGAELNGRFGPGRAAQLAMLVGLVPGAILFAITGELDAAVGGLVLAQLFGTLALVLCIAEGWPARLTIAALVGRQAAGSFLVYIVAQAAILFIRELQPRPISAEGSGDYLGEIAAACLAVLLVAPLLTRLCGVSRLLSKSEKVPSWARVLF